jgi:hypothetical protein
VREIADLGAGPANDHFATECVDGFGLNNRSDSASALGQVEASLFGTNQGSQGDQKSPDLATKTGLQ